MFSMPSHIQACACSPFCRAAHPVYTAIDIKKSLLIFNLFNLHNPYSVRSSTSIA